MPIKVAIKLGGKRVFVLQPTDSGSNTGTKLFAVLLMGGGGGTQTFNFCCCPIHVCPPLSRLLLTAVSLVSWTRSSSLPIFGKVTKERAFHSRLSRGDVQWVSGADMGLHRLVHPTSPLPSYPSERWSKRVGESRQCLRST